MGDIIEFLKPMIKLDVWTVALPSAILSDA